MTDARGELFLQDWREGPNDTVAGCVRYGASYLGVTVAERDRAKAHDVVGVLPSPFVPYPTAGRPHQLRGKVCVVGSKETLGTLAASGCESSDIFCHSASILIEAPAGRISPDPAGLLAARSSRLRRSTPTVRRASDARPSSRLPGDRIRSRPPTGCHS